MAIAVQQPMPKILAPGEGDSYQMLAHTLVRKITSSDTEGDWAMFEMLDTAGSQPPVHSHPWHETFYILEGEVEVQIGNQRTMATAGAVAHIPANAMHTFKICSATARVLVIISPAAAEAFYRELGAEITTLPPDPAIFQKICAKHGLQLQ
ncbi:cupin domain-containing protein [Leptolyngbya sp. FACHB-261]|uniref:cupin domain-containing protein n=1 Tax=Leptolyngbya sp. FACHB-261 TaxID=2692806 RepID=UPI001684B8E1|nr:cupin domain-containing protein [Leptolyngbya sp. FACHB-261]MBD2104677.1 cupin domain-containing protein [Leptolyngbya sp. FACHB-261]